MVILFSHYSKERLVMHACARSAKQKYGSIYIFLDKNVFENGCIYIYIYIYIRKLEVRLFHVYRLAFDSSIFLNKN